jgi:hypothetical protein
VYKRQVERLSPSVYLRGKVWGSYLTIPFGATT